MTNYFVWLVVLVILLGGALAMFFVRKRKHNESSTIGNADFSLWIAIAGAVIAALVFLVAAGVLPWPSMG